MKQGEEMKIEKKKEEILHIYNQHKVLIWAGFGVLAAAIAGALIFLPGASSSIAVEDMQTIDVIRGSITENLGEVGNVEAEPSASLTWKSSGVIAGFDLQVGDEVQKDDILMELETSSWPNDSLEALSELLAAELELENMITSDSALQTALQAVVEAELMVQDTKEMVNFWNFNQQSDERIMEIRESYLEAERNAWAVAEEYDELKQALEEDDPDVVAAYEAMQAADLERDKLLRAFNYILGHSYDQDVETDFIEYEAARDDFEVARVQYERLIDESEEVNAAQALVQSLQNTVNEARIIAPFDGTITEIRYLSGEFAASGSMAVQMDDLSNLVVNITVSEIDVAEVAVGQSVVVTFDALPFKEYNGTVTEIASAGSNNSDTVSFDVRVAIVDADEDIKPGFTADVSIITSQAVDALLVPTQALMGQAGNYRVMIVNSEGSPSPVPVEIGASSEEYTEIIGGNLNEGDQVIVSINQGDLSDGELDMMRMMREMNGDGGPPQRDGNGGPPDGGGGGNRP